MTKRSLTPYLFLAPALILIAVFLVYPIASVFYYSFLDYDIVTPPTFIGLRNYERLIGDPTFWKAMIHSIIYLLVTPTIIALSLGAIDEPIQWLAEPGLTLPIAMLLTIWAGIGYYAVIFLAGLQNIPEELYDAAQIDGCSNLRKHWHVSIPGLRPQIVFVFVISSLAALKVFDEIYVLTGRTGGILDSGTTIVFYLWKQAFQLDHAGYASAIAVVLLALTLLFSIVNIRTLERRTEAG